MMSRYLPRCLSYLRDTTVAIKFVRTASSSTTRQNSKESESASKPLAGEEQTVDFGFQKVTSSEKAEKVHKVFEAVASSYDVMNDLMSAGVHRLWKDHFVRKISPIVPGSKILDVAGGTGKTTSVIYFLMICYVHFILSFLQVILPLGWQT